MPSALTFDVWRAQLLQDCERLDKLSNFAQLGDEVLRLLWNDGVAPSVQSIIASDGEAHEPPLNLCSICNKPVPLEAAKADGDGQIVHGDCYIQKLKLKPDQGRFG